MASWAVLAENGVMHTLIERMKVEMKSNTQGENFSMIIPPAKLTDFIENHSARSFSCGLWFTENVSQRKGDGCEDEDDLERL